MPPNKKLNCKGKPLGSGTVSNKRREEFRQKGFERENKNMKLEDEHSKGVDWEAEKKKGNKKARKLTPNEVEEMMNPKGKEEKVKPEVKEEGGQKPEQSLDKRDGAKKPEHSLDKRDGAKKPEHSLDKRDGAKEVPKMEFGPSQMQLKKEAKKEMPTKEDDSLDWGSSSSTEARPATAPIDKMGAEKEAPSKSWKFKARPDMRVAVDWYNTIKKPGRLPEENVAALKKLREHGFQVILMSFCGHNREQEVRKEAQDMGFT